jgi:hypothetical protein
LILHQKPHRHIPIARGTDGGRRRERCFQDDAADRFFRRQRHRDAGAERLAPEHELLRRVTRGGKAVGGLGIGDQASFARLPLEPP